MTEKARFGLGDFLRFLRNLKNTGSKSWRDPCQSQPRWVHNYVGARAVLHNMSVLQVRGTTKAAGGYNSLAADGQGAQYIQHIATTFPQPGINNVKAAWTKRGAWHARDNGALQHAVDPAQFT